MKTAIIIILFVTMPGVIAGLVSSYRAGQKPHLDVYRWLQKFLHSRKKR